MNTEHLLDAIGLLDDDLIQEAERYSRPKASADYSRWLGLAASFVVVIALGYLLRNGIFMGGGNSAAPGNTASGGMENQGAASTATGSSTGEDTFPDYAGDLNQETYEPEPEEMDPDIPGQSGASPAIMVDGVLYWSTGVPVPGEVDESVLQPVTGYTSALPEMDGQTNFSQDLSARYAMTDLGLVVLMDGEWILFDTVPPWER